MSYPRFKPNISPVRNAESDYHSWYDECTCCPYGYHIDLDFVRYCESISKEDKNRTGSIKRRKDRRKQRQSMEMLLGLTPPVLAVLDEAYKPEYLQKSPKIIQKTNRQELQFPFTDGFDDAVSDFERALQRSKNKLSNNLPDVTAVSENLRRVPSISSLSTTSGSLTVLPDNQDGQLKGDFDSVSIESCGLSPMALQNIREALALSLEHTKQLESQVKLIPDLQDELAYLRQENKRLHHQIKSEEASKKTLLNGNYEPAAPVPPNRRRSQSFTHIENFNDETKKEPPPPPPRKDFGVMCGVLTRNIGVGHQNPHTKHAATLTTEFADKWYVEKAKFLNTSPIVSPKITASRSTQTVNLRDKRDMGIQSSIQAPKAVTEVKFCQTDTIQKPITSNAAIQAVTRMSDFAVQKDVESYSIGCSKDTITDVLCEKCSIVKISVGVGPEKDEDLHTSPVSLSALNNRSKSFNLGEERLDLHKRTRTVASQYDNTNTISRGCQSEIKTSSKSSQHEVKNAEKTTQSEYTSESKKTDTEDLKTPTKSVACEIREYKPKTSEKGSNTISEEKEVSEEKICAKCASKEMESSKEFKTPGSPNPSRIPVPTTPIEARKFRRQDTYTKLYSSSPTDKSPIDPSKLSGLDLSPKSVSTEAISNFEKVKENLKLDIPANASTSKSQNGLSTSFSKVQIQETTLPVSESTIFQPSTDNRLKATPSKEMQGAMKVLNDSLQKSPSRIGKNQSAINIVQQEWFKISSLVTANPLDVEDYLDAFEDISLLLLQYIVNMTDVSGNTAMHYAVSHGNFDVVSILLDSKVCDINKPNKAGYTSVMLVSLTEVRSQTHANVIRRLFHLADVNIRASQHGQTALMLAVSHGRLDMVKMLLEEGADINIQDEDGSTALMCAAEHGHIEIVKHFLSQPDCDSSITDVDGSTALKIAMEAGHRHIGVLLYAHERNFQKPHPNKLKKTKSNSPKTPSSPLPIRSSHRALTDTKK
ncbi:KN motif and ankyrin repeat domain-containing protein 2 [Sitophilus oryzae]|uniref:KN motif and ankyrin repeat domain-containing protein 2 n=1 Tax=Sitophilus oryzae TaxID=7048 RepID=A0A6J2XCC8_SITOR|nr:KN motif and ankyrin repeat domain-containing protein 2 [Sitophilus oryzae]